MDNNFTKSFMGVPVIIRDFLPPDSMYLIPADIWPRMGTHVMADSIETVKSRLDEHFLAQCGIMRNIKP